MLAKPWYSPARDFSAPIVRGTTRARGASGTMVRAGTMHDGVRIVLGICQSYISILCMQLSQFQPRSSFYRSLPRAQVLQHQEQLQSQSDSIDVGMRRFLIPWPLAALLRDFLFLDKRLLRQRPELAYLQIPKLTLGRGHQDQ